MHHCAFKTNFRYLSKAIDFGVDIGRISDAGAAELDAINHLGNQAKQRRRRDQVVSATPSATRLRLRLKQPHRKCLADNEEAAYTESDLNEVKKFKASHDVEKATSTPSAQHAEEARKLLETEPRSSRNAAQALMLIGPHLVREQGQQQVRDNALDNLRVSVRNCVAMRIRAEAEPANEESFEAVFHTAFDDVKPHITLVVVIKNAYHTLIKGPPRLAGGFPSRASKVTARRGKRRRKRDSTSVGGAAPSPALEEAPAPNSSDGSPTQRISECG